MGPVDFIQANWQQLLLLTQEHIYLVLLATGAAVIIGVPAGIWVTRHPRFQTPVLGFANIMQTVPSLALFGLLIPLPFIGGIGARTAIIALSLYALLPVVRNTVTGIAGIDPRLIEAADAVGMTGAQRLRIVELPLAMPVIFAGIRIAVVISVGVATIAALVGAGGLGAFIFRGLRQNDNNLLMAGAVASALLALMLDFVLGQFESSFNVREREKRYRRRAVGFIGLALIASIFVAGFLISTDHAASTTAEFADQPPIVVGSKDFTESVILAEILAQLIEREGRRVERRFELGGNLPHTSLLEGQIDVYPEYTGTAYTTFLQREPITDPRAVYDAVQREYADRFGLTVSPQLGFANDFAILIRGEVARESDLKTVSDAVPLMGGWQAGFGQDFMSRADGYPGFVKAYGISFARQPREMDLSLTYRALRSGELDIIAGNSTDGLIAALDLVQLEDDRRYFPPYEAVFIARSSAEEVLRVSMERLANAISTDEMRRMNLAVDGENRQPRDVAAEWIEQNLQ